MPDIKLNTKLGGNEAGTTITTTDGVAQYLTDNGYADHVEVKKARGKVADKDED